MGHFSDPYLPWFVLRELPGIGNPLKKALIRSFGSPDAVLSAPKEALKRIEGMTSAAMTALLNHPEAQKRARNQLSRVRRRGYSVLTLTDPLYPALLGKIPDPPLVLTYEGRLVKDPPCIAIVGSRKATNYGRDTARNLAAGLARKGFTIVSGMAAGIDTAAHEGALEGCGTTFAVMGSGLGQIYPRQNKGLYSRIIRQGSALSEFDVDAPPLARHFPVRNRIIAGMACGTLVVEAARKSGSLITARLAGEYNREVFSVPGSVRSSQSRGTHDLIRQGAHIVETENDLLAELLQFVHPEPAEPDRDSTPVKKCHGVMDKDEALVYKHLDPYPRHIDEIIEAAGIGSGRVTAILTEMELSGRIRRHPGNLFSLSEE